jgi:hypothetical protein
LAGIVSPPWLLRFATDAGMSAYCLTPLLDQPGFLRGTAFFEAGLRKFHIL